MNQGFCKRKYRLFNNVANVSPDAQAGHFSYRIPLAWLFNFCSDYRKVMYNIKHELRFQRQSDEFAIFNNTFVDKDIKVSIDLIRWYMPNITQGTEMRISLMSILEQSIPAPFACMNKRCECFPDVTPGGTSFSATLTYPGGVEKPRYIIAAFQSWDKTKDGADDIRNINHSIFNGTHLGGRSLAIIDLKYIMANINGTDYNLVDVDNNVSQGRYARWYNEYKKFKLNYTGDMSEGDIISYQDFVNLYRLNVVDISKQVEGIALGVANVKLTFYFNSPIPAFADCKIDLYCVSFYDRIGEFKSNKDSQFIMQ